LKKWQLFWAIILQYHLCPTKKGGGILINSAKSDTIFTISGISTPTLYKWVSHRKIPYIKMGRLVKFDPLKLEEWIKQQTVMPMPERKG